MATITVLDINTDFRKLETWEHKLNRMEISDGYYTDRAKFQGVLKDFLDKDFTVLSKDKLMKLMAWQYTYQPVAHHRFLMRVKSLSTRL